MGFADFMGRVANILTGKADVTLSNAEKGNVEETFRGIILKEEDKLKEAREVLKEAKGYEFSKGEEIIGYEKALNELTSDLTLAIKENNEELGAMLVGQQEALKGKIETAKADLISAKKESSEILSAVGIQEKYILTLKEEARTAKSTMKSSEILERIQESKKGLGLTSEDKALDNIREKVAQSRATRAATSAVAEESVEHKLEDLRKRSATNSATEKFRQMVAETASSKQ